MLTRVRSDLPLALGLLDGRLPFVVFAVTIIGGNRGLVSPHQFLCSLPPCARAILASRWDFLPHFRRSFCVFTAGAAVAQWGNQRNLHLRLGPAPPEERKAPPLLSSPMVAGGDQRRGRAISASFASGA